MKFDIVNLPNGTTFNLHRRKYHIVASCHDRGVLLYVVRYYGRYKQWWHYEVFDSMEIEGYLVAGLLKNLKPNKGE